MFVGRKAVLDQVGGVWVFVTDSSGSTVLWEKQLPLPYQSNDGLGAVPNAVAATLDSGFTVVGKNQFPDSLGGIDAFVAHFVPEGASAARISRVQGDIRCFRAGGQWAVAFTSPTGANAELSLLDLDGKILNLVRTRTGAGETVLHFDSHRASAGLHVLRLKLGGVTRSGKIVF